MILGLPTSVFTAIHVLLSLVGIGSGFVFVFGLVRDREFNRWTSLFLGTTTLTSLTGFAFPFHGMTPGIVIGILSMIVLAVAMVARYTLRRAGSSRWIYLVSAMLALYFNVFVLIAQSFEKVPALKDLAPTQSEPPFAIAQLAVLALFVAITVRALKRFHTGAVHTAELQQVR